MYIPATFSTGYGNACNFDQDPPVREQEGPATPLGTWNQEPKVTPAHVMPSAMGSIPPGAGNSVQQQWQTQQVMNQVWDPSSEPSQELKEMGPETGMETRLKHRSKGTSKIQGQRQDWR